MKKLCYLTLMLGLFISWQAYAYVGHCSLSSGAYIYSYSPEFTSTQNKVGYMTAWKNFTNTDSNKKYIIGGGCDGGSILFSGQPSPFLTAASSDSNGNWYNISNNPYLQVAVQMGIYSRTTGITKPYDIPFADVSNNCDYKCSAAPAASGSTVNIRLRIKKRFVGKSFLVNEPIAYLYANQGATGLGFGEPIVIIQLSLSMTVPQSCTIKDNNSGSSMIDFDFGNISAQSFARAGAGQKPSTVAVQKSIVGISCNNIDAQTTLTMRIQANTISGNAVVSDNPDVGFVLANSSGTPLTPNNTNSVIPFTLDDNYSANVGLEAWPVSITGKQPAAGLATALGYLRVDFQ